MDRKPQQQTERPRRSTTGVTLVTTAIVAAFATLYASAMPGRAGGLTFPNPNGAIGSIGSDEANGDNPFFQELGSNGRTCATCHRAAQGWSITPAELRDRFERTNGLDPIFRTNDGSNCEGAEVSTVRARRRAFSLLLQKGLIRIALDVPVRPEFDILEVEDPYRCGGPLTAVSV